MADSVSEAVVSEVSASEEDSDITDSVLEVVVAEFSASEEFPEVSEDVVFSTEETDESPELPPHAVKESNIDAITAANIILFLVFTVILL